MKVCSTCSFEKKFSHLLESLYMCITTFCPFFGIHTQKKTIITSIKTKSYNRWYTFWCIVSLVFRLTTL